jgi:hypothetical protein
MMLALQIDWSALVGLTFGGLFLWASYHTDANELTQWIMKYLGSEYIRGYRPSPQLQARVIGVVCLAVTALLVLLVILAGPGPL